MKRVKYTESREKLNLKLGNQQESGERKRLSGFVLVTLQLGDSSECLLSISLLTPETVEIKVRSSKRRNVS